MVEAATRLVYEGDDPVQLVIDVLLQMQQADAATITTTPSEGGLTMFNEVSMRRRPRGSWASHK